MADSKTEVKIDQNKIRGLARPGGIVHRDLQKRAKKVERAAKRMAPRGMRKNIMVNTTSGHVRVECDHPATLFVIKGTKAHYIRKGKVWKGKKVLKFKIGGRVVFARWVKHPGTKPNDFMTKALREAK